MGDKDKPNIFNGKQEILLFQVEENPALATPLGEVVADSLTILSEEESSTPINNTLSFEVEIENPAELLLLQHPDVQRCIDYAQSMLNEIQSEVKRFYRTDPPRNRKERRERAKALEIKIKRFNAYCKAKGIEISSK